MRKYSPLSHETLAVSTSVVSLNPELYKEASRAVISVEQPVRMWADGGIPKATEGHLLDNGAWLELENNTEIKNFKVIRSSGLDATLSITYYA